MKKLMSYLWQRLGQLLLWVTATLGSTPTTENVQPGSVLSGEPYGPRKVHWLDAPLDINPRVVYNDVQSEFNKGETNMLTTKTKTTTKAATRWEVVNLKTDKTVKFAKSRDEARAIRAMYAKPTAYGIYDTVSQKFVR